MRDVRSGPTGGVDAQAPGITTPTHHSQKMRQHTRHLDPSHYRQGLRQIKRTTRNPARPRCSVKKARHSCPENLRHHWGCRVAPTYNHPCKPRRNHWPSRKPPLPHTSLQSALVAPWWRPKIWQDLMSSPAKLQLESEEFASPPSKPPYEALLAVQMNLNQIGWFFSSSHGFHWKR